MTIIQTITPCLWFDENAEEAAEFYASVFAESKIHNRIVNHEEWPGGKQVE